METRAKKKIAIWIDRLHAIDWNSRSTSVRACVIVPILFSLWSLYLGQDRNWDMFNYHLYNGFSLIHGKLLTDFAPAGMQTYFNPLLDVFYFSINQALPAPIVGLLMGWLHGLNFVLILGIAHWALPALPAEERYKTPLLLALAGVVTANFLSGLGNSMGDNTTTLFVLCSLCLVLKHWNILASGTRLAVFTLLGAGLAIGVAMGLKLTNAIYAVALCVGLLFVSSGWVTRLRTAVIFGIGALAGLALTGGYWLWTMWHMFGNPLFPQFSSFFPHPLTPPLSVADQVWLPRNLFEYAAWPFIFSADSTRVGQAHLHQIIWPVVYVLFMAFVLVRLSPFPRRCQRAQLSLQARYLITFVAIGYTLWMVIFSIYRYIVPVEMLAPLAVFILFDSLLPRKIARQISAAVLAITSAVVLAGGVETWGHERWAMRAFRAETPALGNNATVVLVGVYPHGGWLAQFYPDDVAFTQIEGSFPSTPLYEKKVIEMIRTRGGPAYAMLGGKFNWRAENIARIDKLFQRSILSRNAKGCNLTERWIKNLRLHARLEWNDQIMPGHLCKLSLRSDDIRDMTAENAHLVNQAQALAQRHKLQIDPSSCALYRAYIGQGLFPYQLCRVKPQ